MKENILDEISRNIKEEIAFRDEITDEELKRIICSEIIRYSSKQFLSAEEKNALLIKIFNQLRKMGILEELLLDDSISEIMINGKDHVFIEKEGRIEEISIHFHTHEELENMIQKMVSKVNRTVNQASPIVDARLLDGSRFNVVLDPVAINGPIVTIRKFSREVLTIEKLIQNKTFDAEVAEFLEQIVKQKYNIFISGGTGSGKTTLLNILSNFIGKNERIITIEDSAELQIHHIKNLVRLETRNKNTEGVGEISMQELIKSSLRMRPDRIIVGEVRGREALDMLQAMNTGHDGSLSTGHANSCYDMLSRLETMVLMNQNLPLEAIRRQIASAINIMIHISKVRRGERKVVEISEICGCKEGEIILNQLYHYENDELVKKNELVNKK